MGGVEVEVVGAGRSMKKNYVSGGKLSVETPDRMVTYL
jgi:hypothetical protein